MKRTELELPSANCDELLAAIDFFRHRQRLSWQELLRNADVDSTWFGKLVKSGDYDADDMQQPIWRLGRALGIPLEELIRFKHKYSPWSPDLHDKRYAVEFLTRHFIIKMQPPVKHRDILIDYCINLVGDGITESTAVAAARDRPPVKIMDVAHIYYRLANRGYFQ